MIRMLINITKRASISRSTYIGVSGFLLITILFSVTVGSNVIVNAQNGQTSLTSIATTSNRKYVGTKRCRMCHTDHYESWNQLAKADSFNALKPGQNAHVKRKAGLDVQRDYTIDSSCLLCHTVGFGKPSGYAIPDPGHGSSARKAASREGVGCESCHGPGSDYVVFMQTLAATGRMYNPSELAPLGRHPVTQQTCQRCHNGEAICMTGVMKKHKPNKSFDWTNIQVGDHHGYHRAVTLKQRVKNFDNDKDGRSENPPP